MAPLKIELYYSMMGGSIGIYYFLADVHVICSVIVEKDVNHCNDVCT